jgi:hypothetical protein
VAITRGWSGSALTAAAVSSLTIDISGGTVGEYVYAFINCRTNETSFTFTGWTVVQALLVNGTAQTVAVYKRLKQSGDTTFTLSWTATTTQCGVLLQQWPGTLSDEGVSYASRTSAGNVYTTPSSTPADTTRWAVGFYTGQNTDSANKTATWAASGDMGTKIASLANTNGSLQWLQSMIADSNAAVTQAGHTGTGTTSGTATINNGAAGILFLVPAAAGSATLTATSSLTAAGSKTAVAAATLAATSALTSAGSNSALAAAILAATSSLTVSASIPTSKLLWTAEGGTNGATIAFGDTGNGDAFDVSGLVSGGVRVYSNTHALAGSLSARFSTGATAGTNFLGWTTSLYPSGAAAGHLYLEALFYFTAAPAAAVVLLAGRNGAGNDFSIQLATTDKLQLRDANNVVQATFSNSVPFNQAFRVGLHGFTDTSAGTIEGRLWSNASDAYGSELEVQSLTAQNTGTAIDRALVGILGSLANVSNFWADSVTASTSVYPSAPIAGAATLAASSSLTAGALNSALAAATLAATSSITVAGAVTELAAATFAATSSLTTAGKGTALGAVTLSASSTLTVAGGATALAAATLAAASSLTVTGAVVDVASATLSALSTLTAGALLTRPGAAVLAATSTLTVGGFGTVPAAVTLAALSALAVAATTSAPGGVLLGATSTLTVAGAVTVRATVTLAATSILTAAGIDTGIAAATLTATSTLTTTATAKQIAVATLSALSALTAAGQVAGNTTATLLASSTHTVGGAAAEFAAAMFVATSGLTTTGGTNALGLVVLAAVSGLSGVGASTIVGSALLSAVSSLTAAGSTAAFAPITPRPDTGTTGYDRHGITPRPSTGTTARGSGITVRPFAGTTTHA